MGEPSAEKRTEFLTARQLADVLQVSEATVRRLRQAGRIPSIRVTDRIVRFNLREVRQALSKSAKARADARPVPAVEESPFDRAQMNFSEVLTEFETGE